eukprot:3800887-Ditylum_brightwellii.AAC.1
MGYYLKQFLTNFDEKIMGWDTVTFIKEEGTIIQAAPPEHQNENGLCERSWHTISRMARAWLVSNFLPSSFWWFAVKRATEVCNYILLNMNSVITTSHEAVVERLPTAAVGSAPLTYTYQD